MGISDFFTPEAGQRRTQWLNGMEQQLGDALSYYLGPTGIPQRLGAAAQIGAILSPGSDMVDAMYGSGQIMQAKSPLDAAAGAATMAGGLGAMFLPGTYSGLRQGFNDAVDAGMRAHNSGALFSFFGPSVSGAGDDVAARGAQILDMLKSGRAPEVTDAMLDMGDPVKNARLNEFLYQNYDLPMDANSRAARADKMGFGDTPLYHGTAADFPAFADARRGNFFTDRPDIADIYAAGSTGGSASIRGQAANAGANYVPVKLRGPDLTVTDKGPDGSHGWLTDNIATSVPGVEKFPLGTYPRRLNEAARTQGYGSIRIDDMLDLGGEQTQWMSIDPTGIRSRFARFDPRLAHLRNLSAAGAGAALAPMFMQPQEGPQ